MGVRMKEATFVFPNQLFKENPAVAEGRLVFLIEDFLFFKVQPFHKQRLVLLRAAMKGYADFLCEQRLEVSYLDSASCHERGAAFNALSKHGLSNVHVVDVVDDWLKQDLEDAAKQFGWILHWHTSPQFLNVESDLRAFFKQKKRFSQAQFYAHQRRRLNILMTGDSPIGGKFSFDAENRKKLPKGFQVPKRYHPDSNTYLEEAIGYVNTKFPNSIGDSLPFAYATTFEESNKQLEDFLLHRLANFGRFEDAISTKEPVVFHSVLSPLLNIGLLTPKDVLQSVLEFSVKHDVPLSSLEGFIRQVIGWREYVRACYMISGSFERTSNIFQHTRELPKGFWDGTTGIDPVDATIKKILATGYCHHIERLMVLGNFLLLTETSPDRVYHWFMAFFVDAYDWVMVPNVYGMSQFSDGGLMTTKPYISGSNYILKMSDYKKGEWVEIWDGLFWRFLAKHEKLFSSNPRTQMLLSLLSSKSESIQPKIQKAENWMKQK
jgi:deoxyribodipyrimidine photolyase-related protein